MRILLLGFARIATMPYMFDYVELLKSDHELHLISWNRSGKEDMPVPQGISKSFVFSRQMRDEDPMKKKVPSILGYRRFAKKIIRREKYDRIVVLHSTPGVSILDYLLKHYSGKYLLDYRDVSHEGLGGYRRLISRLSCNAGLVIASSPAFFKYLENERGVTLKHNLLLESGQPELRRSGKPIRIRYWGMIRHESANLALIDELGGDERFELHYNGREEAIAERLKAHANERGFENIFFHGSYYNNERLVFASDTDIIHNVYENDFATTGAMGNKYYDGVQFRIPQLCTEGSIMGDLVSEKGIGLAIDYSKHGFKDSIVDYLNSIDYSAFDDTCKKELQAIKLDNHQANDEIVQFFSEKA